jgi:glycosyltransferase involved in cell wall biosynthesis
MRIALFHNVPSGGAKRAIYEWTRRLSVDHEIDVFTQSSADHDFCDIRPLVRKHYVFDFAPRTLFRSPWGRLNQFQRWRDLRDLTRLGYCIGRAINAGSYDVVFAHTCLYTFIPTFLKFVKTPAVYYLHEPFGLKPAHRIPRPYLQPSKLGETLNRFDPLIRLYYHRLDSVQRQSLRHTTRLLANSRFTQEQMKAGFNLDTSVCYLGVDGEQFCPLSGVRKENFVLSVGELSYRKGFDFIVASLGRIPQNERPKLKVACNTVIPQERDYVEHLSQQHGVQLEVLFRLGVDELTLQYNQARLCVYAPVNEPFGLVPLEAMSCGTPVVGVREGGVQETIVHERTGLLAEREPVQFATAVQHLLSNPRLASEYGRNGRAHVSRNWTWDQSVASLEKHLIECSRKT